MTPAEHKGHTHRLEANMVAADGGLAGEPAGDTRGALPFTAVYWVLLDNRCFIGEPGSRLALVVRSRKQDTF